MVPATVGRGGWSTLLPLPVGGWNTVLARGTDGPDGAAGGRRGSTCWSRKEVVKADREAGSTCHDEEAGPAGHDEEAGPAGHDEEAGPAGHDEEAGSAGHDGEARPADERAIASGSAVAPGCSRNQRMTYAIIVAFISLALVMAISFAESLLI